MSEKINLIEDRDYFTRNFRKFLNEDKRPINESTGGRLWNLLGDLESHFESLPQVSTSINEGDVIKLKRALNALEKEMKKVLKNKGLKNW